MNSELTSRDRTAILVGHLVSLLLVGTGAALLFMKYGLAEAVAFAVIGGLLSDIRTNLMKIAP